MRLKLECCHATTCLPDYWGGHHLPHVQIPARRGMSMKEIKAAIRSELSEGAVAGSVDDARLLSADLIRPEEEPRADALTRAAYAAVNRMKPAKKGQRRFFLEAPGDEKEKEEDSSWSIYAYFVFCPLD